MFNSLRRVLHNRDIRGRIFYTLLMLVIVRIGSQLPAPGVNPEYIKQFFESQTGDIWNFVDAFTGGSFTQMSVFALSITPYITSTIVIQLMTIVIPSLEEMQRDGEDGRKKIAAITRYMTVALALLESTAIGIGFGRQGLLENYSVQNVAIIVLTLTAGSAFLMWAGERITECGVGNGISIILLINIISRAPSDLIVLYEQFIKGKRLAPASLSAVIILFILLLVTVFVIFLQGGERRIAIQNSQKIVGKKTMGGQKNFIPLKVNTAGVIPVIFTSSMMQIPVLIANVMGKGTGNGIGSHILRGMSSDNWCNPEKPWYSIGMVVYMLLTIFFAYFYTSITFSPLEIADNLRKSGSVISGIRPGKPTALYLQSILQYIIFIGASGLIIVQFIPFFFNGVFGASVSFGGTSLIIIVGVIIETMKQVGSKMISLEWRGHEKIRL